MITTRKRLTAGAFVLVTGALVSATACSTTTSTAKPAPAKTVTAPAPPAVTQTVSPPPPAAGTQVAKFNGTGNANTATFNVPSTGDYVVSWNYSGNVDNSLGTNTPDNFNISTTGPNGYTGNLPNDIAASGHGSTEITGDSGTDSFNVMANAACNWTITVVSAS